MTSRIRLAGPSTIGPMAHRVASPARTATLAIERLVTRAVEPLPAVLRRRPMLTAAAAVACLATIASRLIGAVPGGASTPRTDGSALAFFGAPTGGPTGGSSAAAASLPLGAAAGSIDVVDLLVKGLLVIVLLFVTLRVLRRFQTGGTPAGARIRVLESRTIGPKATLHLVAIGDRQLVVGLTPGRLVTLAELSADELDIGAGEDLDLGLDGADGSRGIRGDGFAPAADLSLTSRVARRIAAALR
jgi:flagellar biosynthetic protein FliO